MNVLKHHSHSVGIAHPRAPGTPGWGCPLGSGSFGRACADVGGPTSAPAGRPADRVSGSRTASARTYHGAHRSVRSPGVGPGVRPTPRLVLRAVVCHVGLR
jgi:hypothetical protein